MNKLTAVFGALVLLTLVSPVMAQPVTTQVDMTDGSHDVFITAAENTYCRDIIDITPEYVGYHLGGHQTSDSASNPWSTWKGISFATQADVDADPTYGSGGYAGLPNDGVVTVPDGSGILPDGATFQIAVNNRDNPGENTVEDIDTWKSCRNGMYVYRGNYNTDYSFCKASMTLDVSQQGQYDQVNFMLFGTRTDRNVRIKAVYSDGEVQIFYGGVPHPKTAAPSSPFVKVGPTMEVFWRTYYSSTQGSWFTKWDNGTSDLAPISYFAFEAPLALDNTRTLTGFYIECPTDGTAKMTALNISAISLITLGEAGGPEVLEADLDATDIPDDGAATATLSITIKDGNGVGVADLEGDITVVQTGAGTVTVGDVTPGALDGDYTVEITGTGVGEVQLTAYYKQGTGEEIVDTLAPVPDVLNVYDPEVATQGTASISPDVLPDDGVYPGVLAITLKNAVGQGVSGLEGDVDVAQTGGTGTVALGAVGSAGGGIYSVAVTGQTAGTIELTVTVYDGAAGEFEIGPVTCDVVTPGSNDFPLAVADATPTETTDDDDDGVEQISLDGLSSQDTTGITRYVWTWGTTTLADDDSGIYLVDLPIGTHTLWLTVYDADDQYHMDSVVVTINPPAVETQVRIDMTYGTYDAYITAYEAAWFKDNYNDETADILGDHHGEPCQEADGQLDGASFATQQELDNALGAGTYTGLPNNGVITHTGAAGTRTYYLAVNDRDMGPFILGAETKAGNALYCWKPNQGSVVPGTMTFKSSDQRHYQDINVLLESRSADLFIIALYDDGAGGTEEVLVKTFSGAVWNAASAPAGYEEVLACDAAWLAYPSSVPYNRIRTTGTNPTALPIKLWTFDTNIALDPGRKLMGLKVDATAQSGTRRVCIYAATATPADPVSATIDRTHITSDGSITATMLVTILSGGQPVSDVAGDITVTQTGGTGTASAGSVSETAIPGTYEVTITGSAVGTAEMTASYDGDSDQDPDTVTVYDPDAATQGTADIGPDQIPSNAAYPATLTITLKNAVNQMVTGAEADIEVTQTGGTGTATLGSITEIAPGVYEVTITGTGDGSVQLSVVVYEGTAGELTPAVDPVVVFTPGAGGYPQAVADASPLTVTDADRDGREGIDLDGSASSDDVGLARYLWTAGSTVLYDSDLDGYSSTASVDLPVGTWDVVLTVTDDDGKYHMDSVTVTVEAAADDSVPLDLSDGFNYDAVGTWAENSATEGWYAYWSAADPGEAGRTYTDGTGLQWHSKGYNRNLDFVFTDDPWLGIPMLYDDPPVGDNEWYIWEKVHMRMVGFPTGERGCYACQAGNVLTLQPQLFTDYGTYAFGPFDSGASLVDVSQWIMPPALNAIRIGTAMTGDDEGTPTNWNDSTDPEAGLAQRGVLLPPAQQKRYTDVNFLVSGLSDGRSDGGSFAKWAWLRIYALYEGEEATPVEIFESPPIAYIGQYPDPGSPDPEDIRNWVAGGVPRATGATTDAPRLADFGDLWDNTEHEVALQYYTIKKDNATTGEGLLADPFHAALDGLGSVYMYEVSVGGLALNPAKVLVGFAFEVDNGPESRLTGESRADTVNIYAASAHEAEGEPLEIAAEVTAGEEWVYQNTETTTDDRHISTATITLVGEATPGEVYDISIADDGPDGANFTLGAVTDNRPGDDTLVVEILGGRVEASTIGGGGAAYNVTITVEGQDSEESDSAQVQVSLLRIGDIDRDGSLTGLDRQLFNQRLNNVATPYTDRTFDLDGSGGAPTGTDKQVMNQALNNVPLP